MMVLPPKPDPDSGSALARAQPGLFGCGEDVPYDGDKIKVIRKEKKTA
jgi:hypothetical protein